MGLPLLHRSHSSPHLSGRPSRVHRRGAEQQSDSWSHLGTGDCAPSVVRSIPWFWMGILRSSIATKCETLALSFDRAFHLWAWSGHGTDFHFATLVGGLDARCSSGIRQGSSIAHTEGLSFHIRPQRGDVSARPLCGCLLGDGSLWRVRPNTGYIAGVQLRIERRRRGQQAVYRRRIERSLPVLGHRNPFFSLMAW